MIYEPTPEEVLNELDPDWSERWRGDVAEAARYYQQYGFDRWMEVVRELRGDE
jgi:hypothetical protein